MRRYCIRAWRKSLAWRCHTIDYHFDAGRFTAWTRRIGHPDELVRDERGSLQGPCGTGNSAFMHLTLDWVPVHPGTLRGCIWRAGDYLLLWDDMDGHVMNGANRVGTINYVTGTLCLPGQGTGEYRVDYMFDSGAVPPWTPAVPMALVSSPMRAAAHILPPEQ